MVNWKRLNDDAGYAPWQALLDSAEDANPFQSRAWAQFKQLTKWESERWEARSNDGSTLACLQILKKRLPLGRQLVWAPGGPAIGFAASRPEAGWELLKSWIEAFRREQSLVYARFRIHLPFTEEWAASLARVASRPRFKINSGVSIRIDLTASLESLRAAMTSKHRYYVKQSEKAGLEWRSGFSEELAAHMTLLYREMTHAKGIESKSFDPDSIAAIVRAFGKDAIILVGYRSGEPVTSCLVLRSGNNAFYLMAATSVEGRKSSAAYAMVSKLLEILKAHGIRAFDFGGLDPGSESAAGVDHFKKGFGGNIVEYLGEWEWACSSWLGWAANTMMRRKLA